MSGSSPLSNDSADICGLPIRDEAAGRDPLERIASDYLESLRKGTPIDLEEIVRQYPEFEGELREFLPLVAAMETWKSQQEMQTLRRPLPETFEITRLGDCRIVREIARGGMGVVFEAEQEPIGRKVAVKLLPWRFPRHSKWGQQFLSEARIAAGLQHSHIVPVFSFGEDQQRFYYVMQIIEGVGLDRLIDRWAAGEMAVSIENLIAEFHPPGESRQSSPTNQGRILRRDSWQQLGKIAAQVTSAIRYAHKQGTLHRDIKPANLLIDIKGKTWIADFGLAMARDQAMEANTESLAGTIRYMAPEQFAGISDVRTDLYAFGVTLYELATLRPPFVGETKEKLIATIREGKPPRPRSVNPEIPVSLETIILKAMAVDPQKRYQNADQLHADLLSFLNAGKSKSRQSLWRSIRKWF